MWGPTSPPIHPTRFPSPTSSSKTHFHQDSLLKHHGCVIFLLVSWTVEWKSRRGERTPLTAEGRASGHPRTRGRAQGVRRNARGSESCRLGHAAAGARRGEPGDPGPGSEEPRAAPCAGSEREPRAPAASGTTWDTEEKVRKSEGQARPRTPRQVPRPQQTLPRVPPVRAASHLKRVTYRKRRREATPVRRESFPAPRS